MKFGKQIPSLFLCLWSGGACLVLCGVGQAQETIDLSPQLAQVRAVGKEGKGHAAAIAAMKQVSQAPATVLPVILAAMDGAAELPQNWLRAAAEASAQRATAAGQSLPVKQLEMFLADTRHAPRARRLAYELIASVDDTAEKRLIPQLINDPSLELRRDAVAQLLDAAAKAEKPASLGLYQKSLLAARDLDQIKAAAAKLKDLGEKPDLPTHMGYLIDWRLVGPFDNVEDKGWDVAYAPELGVNLEAELDGQKDKVKWVRFVSEDDFGVVDLNKALTNHKGAIAYAYTVFQSGEEREVDLRVGCINAHKVWVNGKEVMQNHVYHAGMEVDQYNARVPFKKGANTILVKICQNEQKEAWAQRWQFQLRICDEIGTAVLSADRPVAKAAGLPAPANGRIAQVR